MVGNALEFLIGALKDQNQAVRHSTAWAIGEQHGRCSAARWRLLPASDAVASKARKHVVVDTTLLLQAASLSLSWAGTKQFSLQQPS